MVLVPNTELASKQLLMALLQLFFIQTKKVKPLLVRDRGGSWVRVYCKRLHIFLSFKHSFCSNCIMLSIQIIWCLCMSFQANKDIQKKLFDWGLNQKCSPRKNKQLGFLDYFLFMGDSFPGPTYLIKFPSRTPHAL